ncbi:hypothetical protein OMP38_32035 [Cohnella ginsengisoli]|uniref:Uncharacterized protein n=1 Tax=Cohnella ginsengisoli TaxID=425004 RepID=A0A9X4QRJ0_9BACL|nr:hypothetical protein [Cohnella ginsengisoli]MDG0794945.1 hypothetical protein [Cohnella ginsengisoli]
MSRYVKISCMAPPNKEVDAGLGLEDIVLQMIARWEERLQQVLPERPDLIVLPECCDDPAYDGMRAEWLDDYYRYRGESGS